MVSSKPGTKYQKPEHPTDRETGEDSATGGARPHYGHGNAAIAAFLWLPCGAAR